MLTFLSIASFVAFLGWYSYNITAAVEFGDYYQSCDYYYRYNDRFGVQSPPTRLQLKRFSYARMINTVPRTSVEPQHLDDYRLDDKNNTGVFPTWNTDHEALGDMCNWIISLAYYYLRGVTASESDGDEDEENGGDAPGGGKGDGEKGGDDGGGEKPAPKSKGQPPTSMDDGSGDDVPDGTNDRDADSSPLLPPPEEEEATYVAVAVEPPVPKRAHVAPAAKRDTTATVVSLPGRCGGRCVPRVTYAGNATAGNAPTGGSYATAGNAPTGGSYATAGNATAGNATVGNAPTGGNVGNADGAGNGITKNPQKRRDLCLRIMIDWVHRYDTAIRKATNNKFDKVFPWGKNWYQFSISSSLALYHHMIVAHEAGRDDEVEFAADLILRIIVTPKKSLGATRDQANSIYMGLPWILARYFRGDVKEAAQHPDYKYVVEYIKFPMVQQRKTEGLYLDKTYITHTNVLAYGYLSEMTNKSLPIVAFDNMLRNFMLDWSACKRLLSHPTIPYSTIGLYTRATKLSSFVNPDSSLGVAVVPTTLILRMYGPDYAFAVRGLNEWIAYYESDKTDDTMAQYWVQSRQVFFAGQDYQPTFPAPGFYYQKWEDEARTTPVTTRARLPTLTSTTTPFTPAATKNKYLSFPFVFSYGSIGILRHFYTCTELRYGNYEQGGKMLNKNPTPNYGVYTVDEFILCDYAKGTIDIWARIQMKNVAVGTMVLCAETPVEWSVETNGGLFLFHMSWNVKTRKLTHSPVQRLTSTHDELAKVYPPGIEVVNTDNTVMLIDRGQPKIAMYPDRRIELDTSFSTMYEGKEYTFVFDSLTNQYSLAGLCIDK